jgi:protein-S-isoprenylcysteine O-methyltransferase Ste14
MRLFGYLQPLTRGLHALPLSETTMSQLQTTNPDVSGFRIVKVIAFFYGIVAYIAFFVTILYAIGFVMGVFVPKTIDTGSETSNVEAIVINLLLMSLFAVQHSVMARKRFKAWWTQFVPKAIERSTYVLFASLSLLLLFWQWRPMPAIVWQIDNPDDAASVAVIGLMGWILVFISTFLINHFELFGLQQVANNLADREAPAPRFRTPLIYRFVRHPIYLGFIIAVWAAPTMTVGHLLFASVITAYIFVGILLEERDLVELFGEDYRQYRKRVSMLIPWRKST